jgi:hypothetical protein
MEPTSQVMVEDMEGLEVDLMELLVVVEQVEPHKVVDLILQV